MNSKSRRHLPGSRRLAGLPESGTGPETGIRQRALGNPEIDAPLVPPAGAFDYRVGKAYVLHVSHPKGTQTLPRFDEVLLFR